MKYCTNCDHEKNDDEFVKGRNCCKQCNREYQRKYRNANKERIAAYTEKFYSKEENKRKRAEQFKRYVKDNKEKIKKYQQEYRKS